MSAQTQASDSWGGLAARAGSTEMVGLRRAARGWRLLTSAAAASIPFLAAALLIAVGGWQIGRSRDAALVDAHKDARNLSRSFAQHAERTIETVEVTLADVVERLGSNTGKGLFTPYLRRRAGALGQVREIVVTDVDGQRLVGSAAATLATNASDDQSYFRWHRDRPADPAMHIGGPVERPGGSGRQVIPLSRSLNNADGSFAGVVVAFVELDYFQRLYSSFGLSDGSAIALWSEDGRLLARHPAAPDSAGQDYSRAPLFVALRAAPSGVYNAPSGPIDGVARILSYDRLHQYPSLMISAAISTDEALGTWREEALLQSGVLAFAALGLIAVGLRTEKQHRRVRQAKTKARATSALLTGTLENMDQGLMMVEADGRIAVCNATAAAMLDLPADLVASDPNKPSPLGRYWPAEEAGAAHPHETAQDGGRPGPRTYERIGVHGIMLEVRSTPMAGGRTVCTYTDVTARRATEAELLRAKEAAESAAQVKTDFLATMSHELRTPLNSIIGFSGLMIDSGELKSPTMARYARLVQEASTTLLSVVDDVLDMSKMEAGGLELDPRPFSPTRLLEDTAELVRAQAEAKGLDLIVVADPALPPMLLGDDARLRQVLLNLLSNAVKFTATGFVEVTAVPQPNDDPARARIQFSVSDSGIGIPQSKRHRVFERFSQVDNSIARQFGGTGLGLSICRNLVDLMGGTIQFESEEGHGSLFSFTVEMPLSSEPAETPTPAPAPAQLPPFRRAEGVRILLVEDVPMNQELAVTLLNSWGYEVDVAEDGAAALSLITKITYDLVLMDVQMPVMNGIEATGRIRALGGRFATVPILAMTANVLAEETARFLAAGMTDHLGKPFAPKDLLAAVRKLSHAPAEAVLASIVPPRPSASSMIFDRAVFEELRETFGSERMRSLLTKFETQLDRSLVETSDDTASRTKLTGEAHSLVSTAGALGFRELSSVCRELQTAGRDSGSETVRLTEVFVRMKQIKADSRVELAQVLAELAEAA